MRRFRRVHIDNLLLCNKGYNLTYTCPREEVAHQKVADEIACDFAGASYKKLLMWKLNASIMSGSTP